ncbi:hypothetical protein N180_02715 [Pedobacter antarcticus 4BY]|uniref:Peptidase S74 domain-containing protein n=2 Tax=Pedobacter antarcticus TaxID=34086 RepID=A0A081PKF4_9SPHI|nr:phage tail protein [Pedobacter antarcticus]KEQ31177.1 hypothetical protein N180_02715 [Pedobacter antarcticus 4BY]SFE54129.1 Chaperone of endosialidase [Pedobacter antarcticus]
MNNELIVYRGEELLTKIDIDQNTVYSEKLPGTDLVACPVSAQQALDLLEGDYILHEEQVYKINKLPKISKSSESLSKKYEFTFEALFYDLLDTFVMRGNVAIFPYHGSARDHLQLVIDSANRGGSGWQIGEVDITPEKLLEYDWTYVRASLDNIAEAFGLEWKVTGKTIRMVKTIGRDTGLQLEYGRGKGLHQISRASDESKNVVNRVYGIGGTRNIEATYRGGVEKNLVFEERFVETPGVTAGTERLKEGKYENLDIYPKFLGSVKATRLIRAADGKITGATITDPAIDFDLMLQLQPEVKAKVGFLSGPLTGVEFEVSDFSYALRTVTIIPNTDTNGYVLPNELNFPELGNSFTFYDIIMPDSYKLKWENELKAESLAYLNDNKTQRLIYGVKPDPKFLRDNNVRLRCGDRTEMYDEELQVEEMLRFTEISYPLVDPFDLTAIIGNDIRFDRVTKLFADVLQAHQDIQVIDRKSIELARRATANLRVLESSIFDTDGKFDMDLLNVGVLTTALGIYGVRSQNFLLSGVYITDNYQGNPNAINISAGELIHMEFSNPGNRTIWQMQALTQSDLLPASRYYVYSKCSKSSQVGSFVLSTAQILPEDVSGFYMFLTGIVYPVLNGLRDSEFSNGITSINGNRIKTGKIESPTGELVINLLTSTIFGKISFKNGSVTKDLVDVDNQTTANKTAITVEESRAIADAVTKLAEAKADATSKVEAAKVSAAADALSKAAAAELSAKNYANSQDVNLKALTDAYADGKITAEEQARIDQAAANLQAARNEIEIARLAGVDYANAQIAIARTQIISSASTDAQSRANQARIDAISSSNLYAASEAAAQRLIAEAYADGKVTAEEQARIDQALINLNVAKADATAKANAAAAYGQQAQLAYNNLTASLRSLAYQDVEQMAINGTSVFSGGKLNVVLLDALYIRSNIIDVGYIQGMNLNFTQGRIGGWNISSSNLFGSNGGTSIELNVTAANPFIQILAGQSSTRIDYQGIRTTYTVTDDVLVKRGFFIDADHVFVKSGTDSNGDSAYNGRVGAYGSNGYAFIERKGVNGENTEVNAYAVYAAHGTVSDMRYKKQVNKSPYGLKEVMKLDTIRFKYDLPDGHPRGKDDSLHIGLSAQQVMNIIPEAAHQIDGVDMLAVTLSDLVPVLINAIQELKQQIDNLKTN